MSNLKPEKVIYYNELSKLKEYYTQDEYERFKSTIKIGGNKFNVKDIFEELRFNRHFYCDNVKLGADYDFKVISIYDDHMIIRFYCTYDGRTLSFGDIRIERGCLDVHGLKGEGLIQIYNVRAFSILAITLGTELGMFANGIGLYVLCTWNKDIADF